MPLTPIITYSAIGVAVFSTGLASWAFYKWLEVKEMLKKYTEKYCDSKEVQRYLIHQYGHLKDLPLLNTVIPKESENYHAQLVEFINNICDEYSVPKYRVLDVGCGPGGTSFHLSSVFEEVIGTDTSMPMIMAGQQLKQFAEFGSPFSTEGGNHISFVKVRVPDSARRDRVTFWDEDVCALSYKSGKFDCVLVSNALTDLHDPKAFFEDIGHFVTTGGLLIISDVYNWENGPEEYLGGEGEVKSFSEVKKVLCQSWLFKKEVDMPFYFPKCARLAEVGNSHVTVWMKKEEVLED